MKRIVSIQDISCVGQCSLTVALPVISSRGIEVSILPSAILSTHTGGFKDFTCLDLTDEMPKIVDHWVREGIKFDAIYTGYIGDARQFELIRKCRSLILKDGGILIADPAMADNGRLYQALDNSIVTGMRELAGYSDVIMPNLTEAAFLLGRECRESYTRAEIQEMLRSLAAMGPEITIITGVSYKSGTIGAAAYNAAEDCFSEYFTDRMAKSYHGTGDIFSSLLAADLLNGMPVEKCMEDACEFIVKCIKKTLPCENHEYGVLFEEVLADERK